MHIVTTTYLTLRRLPSISAWPIQAGTRHPVRMADRDRTPVDVEAFHGDAQLVSTEDRLLCKGIVELPQTDVVDIRPLRSSRRGTAKTGPVSISSGSQSATASPL